MPLLFVGHGSPMNAIEENEFTAGFRHIASMIPKPEAILCVSAHWETAGTRVTAMEKPPTIHDFGGFPRELYEVEYPAPGDPRLAEEVAGLFQPGEVATDLRWGLDHGAWSVLRHLYPMADVPVVQLSIDYNSEMQQHHQIAKQLLTLRENGVLIIGSGNNVHNLGMADWDNQQNGYEWALNANEKIKGWIEKSDFDSMFNYKNQGRELQLAVPTPEHFIPALYVMSLRQELEGVEFFNDKTVLGAISMTSFLIR